MLRITATILQREMSMSDSLQTNNRTCGHCTACCQGWVLIEVQGVEVSPGSPCQHLSKKGCGIYSDRPKICSDFKCTWLINEKNFPVWMRPDKSNVIVASRNFEGTAVLVIFTTDSTPTKKVTDFLKSFSNEYNMPHILYEWKKESGKYTKQLSYNAYAPPGTEAVLARMAESINHNGVI